MLNQNEFILQIIESIKKEQFQESILNEISKDRSKTQKFISFSKEIPINLKEILTKVAFLIGSPYYNLLSKILSQTEICLYRQQYGVENRSQLMLKEEKRK
ncbi:hypothetical protein M0811_14516 [Anaeramoeba ignava]|uniref:Uncharacterized protein n=1 Tax=Anaeramoeba ignava TaxID=1746090 RepID=A0A9Q0RGW7_ANAIG|nr:hypothetical protein M0811_14516 [Anaeramoeba ignava]